MAYIISFVVIIALLFSLYAFNARGASRVCRAGEEPRHTVTVAVNETPLHTEGLTRKEISEKLEKLKESKPPEKLYPGAMCYTPRPTVERIEYLCPACGERTIYARSDRNISIDALEYAINNLSRSRLMVKEIHHLDITLDESEFCKKCRPKVTSPVLVLVVRYPGEVNAHRVKGITVDDLRMLNEFMAGKTIHRYSNDGETPLRDHIPRLKELLGI